MNIRIKSVKPTALTDAETADYLIYMCRFVNNLGDEGVDILQVK